ncbi:DUF6197 family protein [Pseudonocardia xinjiangensis]|uniref:DUF6197 family protein n=1 Tax=Pseudonocardia xinjiangensis TaxID=75289 RepID=UPI001FEA640E|nr:hypothetical protein [Pseudonocardia xinjiangensis]
MTPTPELTVPRSTQVRPRVGRHPWWDRRREQRRLAGEDRRAAHLAELHHIRALVGAARAVVGSGWVQHGWFAYRDEHGEHRTVTAATLQRMGDRPITGACLVGAIVQAGGGPAAVRSQPVQRALDLTWHTLHGSEHEPVHWCPAPPVRAAHVRDLTRWNDQPARTSAEVLSLLRAVERAAGEEIARADAHP